MFFVFRVSAELLSAFVGNVMPSATCNCSTLLMMTGPALQAHLHIEMRRAGNTEGVEASRRGSYVTLFCHRPAGHDLYSVIARGSTAGSCGRT